MSDLTVTVPVHKDKQDEKQIKMGLSQIPNIHLPSGLKLHVRVQSRYKLSYDFTSIAAQTK